MKYHIEFDIDFKRNTYGGLYIAIEGIDGSGKSTQVQALKAYYSQKGKRSLPAGRQVVVTSEPQANSIVGNIIRQVLQSQIKIPSAAFQYLYSADRVMNQEEVVKPSLEKGAIVLSHRSFWSVIPYGVMDKGLAQYDEKNAQILAVAQGLLSMYHQFIAPDITFYLDVSLSEAMNRLSHMDKVKEIYEKKEKLSQILKGYKWQLEQFPDQFTITNGEQDKETITEKLIEKIDEFLKQKNS